MGENVILRQYLRLAGVAAGATVLALGSGFVLHAWKASLFMMGCIVLYSFYLGYQIFMANRDGKYVAIYGICDDVDVPKHRVPLPGKKKTATYRFCVKDNDDDVSYIFIEAEVKRFRPGEAYCLVFRRREDGMFSAENLFGFERVAPEVTLYGTGRTPAGMGGDNETVENTDTAGGHSAESAVQENGPGQMTAPGSRPKTVAFPGKEM